MVVVDFTKAKQFLEITNNQIANAFYDEDYEWIKDNLGFTSKNQMDAEKKIELWKYKNRMYQRRDKYIIPMRVK